MSRAVRRAFERAAPGAREDFVVSREAARRMESRLDYVSLKPQRILEAGCGSGSDFEPLARRYPRAQLVGVDLAQALLRAAARRQSFARRAKRLLGRPAPALACADIARLPFAPASFQMVWSNLALSWVADPAHAFREFARVLAPGGLLTFSTYGPDTLKELRAACLALDSGAHVQRFADMHDLGDLLAASGFAAPVMDMDLITLTYAEFSALAADLRRTGQTYAGEDRRRGLLGRAAWQRVIEAYEALRREGRLPASVELVFGHAWKSERARAPTKSTIQVVRAPARSSVIK